ncbi:hypothetical protein KP509_09G066700 [Ceratopteris richardii]|nr:hypothetical protein KP509_09G066700 [Ceratopteris richardii]
MMGYAEYGYYEQILICFDQMQSEGLHPNHLTFVYSLKACGCLCLIEKGQIMHAEVARQGLIGNDIYIGNVVVDMYALCGLAGKAQEVFDKLPTRDLVTWNALITGYSNVGRSDEAFHCFEQMQMDGVAPDATTLVTNLKACSIAGDILIGQELHAESILRGFSEGSSFLGNMIVHLYANCGLLTDAQNIFDSLNTRDTIIWTSLIAGYTKFGFAEEALNIYHQMQSEGVTPDVVTYICSLKACGSLGEIDDGREIHSEVERLLLIERCVRIGTALIDMYAGCGQLVKSHEVFDKLLVRGVDSWNALMSGYIMNGDGEKVLKCFEKMSSENTLPDLETIMYTLKACSILKNVCQGHGIHCEIIKQNVLGHFDEIGPVLIDMYFNCGSVKDAQVIFDQLPHQDLGSWNILISGYVNLQMYHESMCYLDKMLVGDVSPDSYTYVCGLTACSNLMHVDRCYQLHTEIVKRGLLEGDHSLKAPLMQRTIVWNSVISAHLNLGHGDEALSCCKHMQGEGVPFDAITYISSFKACEAAGASDAGQCFHSDLVKLGFLESEIMIGTALVDMYAAFFMHAESKFMFNRLSTTDVIAWNTFISAHFKTGCESTIFECLERMKLEGVLPNSITYTCALNACSSVEAIKRGKNIEVYVYGENQETDSLTNALVGLYAKCGLFKKAQDVLQRVQVHDVSWWNALISGCSQHHLGEEALGFYDQMQCQGMIPDAITYLCSLKACTSTGQVHRGQEMHMMITKKGLLTKESFIGNVLIDMYAKCGLLADAQVVFDKLPFRDTISWNTIIAGNIVNDNGNEALTISKEMYKKYVYFDVASYLCSFKACGSVSDADYGMQLHSEIVKKGLLEWSIFAGNALIDMYVCCGLLFEAEDVLQKLVSRDVLSWTTLIAGFLRHGCDEEALLCLEKMQQEGIQPDVLTWNALIAGYSHLGEADKACQVLESMEEVEPNEESFQSILAACSHAGLVERGQAYFYVMALEYGVFPNVELFTCMVDLFGRAGHVDMALLLVRSMPLQPDIVAWHTLLAACQKWGNVVVGMEAFNSALILDEKDTATFVSMYNTLACADKVVGTVIDMMEESVI